MVNMEVAGRYDGALAAYVIDAVSPEARHRRYQPLRLVAWRIVGARGPEHLIRHNRRRESLRSIYHRERLREMYV